MKAIERIIENPKTIGEKIVRIIILLVVSSTIAACIFFSIWFYWAIFGN